jgi:hypothetical protein
MRERFSFESSPIDYIHIFRRLPRKLPIVDGVKNLGRRKDRESRQQSQNIKNGIFQTDQYYESGLARFPVAGRLRGLLGK